MSARVKLPGGESPLRARLATACDKSGRCQSALTVLSSRRDPYRLDTPAFHRAGDAGAKVEQVFTEKLPNVPGKSITAIVVTYGPGGRSGKHHHAGSVFAYVLSGAIRSENSATGPARVYNTGESFFEPPGSENASATEPPACWPCSFDDGAPLTTFDK